MDPLATSRALLDASLDPIVAMDAAGVVVEWNAAAEEVLGFSRQEAVGRRLGELIVPPELRAAHEDGLRRYVDTRAARVLGRRIEIVALRSDGCRIPVELAITEVEGSDPPTFTGFIRDVSARRRVERAERILSQVGDLFAVPLSPRARAGWTADLVAAEIGQPCLLALVEDGGVHHEGRGVGADALAPLAEEAMRADPILRDDGDGCVLGVPLRAERRTLGALVTRVPADGTDPPEAELALLGDVAERCALAIERARSYEQRNHEARALQESLLPPQLPLPPGLVVAAGFHAAGDLARLGGDFYDVFELDQGRWAAVVGDIRGKGPQAAVVTARVRHSLRAICDQFSSPAAALGKLNALLLATPEDAMCTVALAYLATDELGTDVALSLAGHPAPLVQARDGDLRQAGAFNALLGAFPAATWEDTSFRLEAGERLVVFTDGMLDQRRSGQRGLVEDELLECLRSLHDAPAQEVADRLVAWTVREQEGQPVDDTAVLVVQSAPETLPAAGRAALAA